MGGLLMGKRLTDAEVAAFERDGVIFPLRVYPEAEAASLRQRLEELARKEGGKLSRSTNQKPHMLLPWLAETIRRKEILDPIEDILGPNILCWASSFFWKPAGDPGFISWHQDFDLLGPVAPRRRHGLGRLLAQHARERLYARRAGDPSSRAGGAPRHLRRDEHAEPRPGDRGRGR